MKIDLTAAARVSLLNCADVGRVRLAKHTRQPDGGIAAGACVQAAVEQGQINKMQQERKSVVAGDVSFPEGGDQHSANGKQALNQYVPKLQGLQNANYISPAPPLILLPLAEEGSVGVNRPRRTMLWQRVFATTAVGTAGARRPPVAPSSSASRPGIEEDAVAILKVCDDRGGAAGDRPTAGSSISG